SRINVSANYSTTIISSILDLTILTNDYNITLRNVTTDKLNNEINFTVVNYGNKTLTITDIKYNDTDTGTDYITVQNLDSGVIGYQITPSEVFSFSGDFFKATVGKVLHVIVYTSDNLQHEYYVTVT
ncbi:MAG: hypothetical protein ACTSSI_14145, partial [Candidatus Helarchaeota archaeon]